MRQNVAILGATGSIGASTIDVLARHPERFRIFALTAFRQVDRLAELIVAHSPQVVVVRDAESRSRLLGLLEGRSKGCEILVGQEGLCAVAGHREVSTVMAAIVGAAGLPSALAAVKAGKRVLLANKEALVMSGALFIEQARVSGATVLPIDSEHNAVFQSLPAGFDYGLKHCGVQKVLLTASGGPFRTLPLEALETVTPEQAVAHPNWVMGRKISVDSATLMNKGLEVIEAHWLFGVGGERIEVVVHPQSVIHSMVQYNDGSVLAQLGNPDMRTPIAHALAYPERIASGVEPLDFSTISGLSFERPDLVRFPCLALAYAALSAGGLAPAVLNAANEVAVAAFLDGEIGFTAIPAAVSAALEACNPVVDGSIESVLAADAMARSAAREFVSRHATGFA